MSEAREGDVVNISEDLLGSSAEFLRTVVDSALAAVVVMNDQGIVTGWGRRAEETFGFSRHEALGRRLVELIVPLQHRDAHNAGVARYRETGKGPVLGQVIELSALHADGREFPAELAISQAAVVRGRTTFIAFVRDITERKEAERRQDELYSYAAEAVKTLRDFASLAVHELRTPLSVANGYLSMLLDGSMGPPSEAWTKPMGIVHERLQEAGRLVNDLLATSRVEEGALQPNLTQVDVEVIVRAAVERAETRARVVGSTVILRKTTGRCRVQADPDLCAKILDNLLNNSLVHGGRWVKVEVELTTDPAPAVSVTDNGPGIAPEVRDRIFERFFRGDEPSAQPGSGLGLYLSRQLAEMQGGTLDLEWSQLGGGSRFTLRFPRAGQDPPGSASGPGRRVRRSRE